VALAADDFKSPAAFVSGFGLAGQRLEFVGRGRKSTGSGRTAEPHRCDSC
jgi:hypothetical protein